MSLQPLKVTTPELVEQATSPQPFSNFVVNQTSSERLMELLGGPVGIGIPGNPLNLKQSWLLEDVFIIVYIVIDDSYKKLFGSQAYFRRSPHSDPDFTDVEIITIALVAELTGYESQNAWWGMVNKNYRYLFPNLCDRSRYNRRLHKLHPY